MMDVWPAAEAERLADEWYGLAGADYQQLRAHMMERDHDAISISTWFFLDGVGLVGPSGHLIADAVSIFWTQGLPQVDARDT